MKRNDNVVKMDFDEKKNKKFSLAVEIPVLLLISTLVVSFIFLIGSYLMGIYLPEILNKIMDSTDFVYLKNIIVFIRFMSGLFFISSLLFMTASSLLFTMKVFYFIKKVVQ